MARRDDVPDDRQVAFAWMNAEEVMRLAERRGGEVVYEAPTESRLPARRARPSRRTRRTPAREPESYGLPFGVRDADGTPSCWSCGRELVLDDVVRVGPGFATCPGCGAKLPFAE